MSAGLSQHTLATIDTLPIAGCPRYVYFDELGLHRLREQALAGSPDWQWIHAEAGRLADAPSPPRPRENEPDAGVLQLAFAHAIWGEQRFLDAAARGIEAQLQAHTWVARFHKDVRLDLRCAVVASSLALACALLADQLPAALRCALRETLEARALHVFAEVRQTKSDWWTRKRMNWQAVINSHIGIALMALPEPSPRWRSRFRLAVEGVLDFLDHCPPDGSFPEGLSYWHYGIGELAWFALGCKTFSQGAIDLFDHPFLRATQDFPLYMATPDGCFDFEDCCNFAPNDWLIALLARAYRNPHLQQLVAPLAGSPRPHRKIEAPARGMRHQLCYDPTLAAEPLKALPCSGFFRDIDTVTMRSDWGPGATFLALHGGRNGVPHGHLDAGSLILGCAGQRIVPDAGFWRYTNGFFDYDGQRWDFDGTSTLGHTSLLVNEQGQGRGPADHARIERVDLGGPMESAVCDVTAAYGGRLRRFVRYLLFVKPRTVLLVDDIEAPEPAHLRWLLQYRGRVCLAGSSLLIENGPVFASVSFPQLAAGVAHRFSNEVRHSYYTPNVGSADKPHTIRYVSLSPVAAQTSWRLVTIIQLSEGAPAQAALTPLPGEPDELRLALSTPEGRSLQLGINFRSRELTAAPS
jgi:hypothetical protein